MAGKWKCEKPPSPASPGRVLLFPLRDGATQELHDFDSESLVPPPTFSFTRELNGGFSHGLVIAMVQPKKSVIYRDSVTSHGAGPSLAEQEVVRTEKPCDIALEDAVCLPLE